MIYVISSTSSQQLPSASSLLNGGFGPKTPASTEDTKPVPELKSESPSDSAPVVDQGNAVTPNPPPSLPPAVAAGDRANATFITLARNSDVWEIARSIRQVEDRFNRKYHYDWVFLNDKPFDATFKKVTSALVSGKTLYGEIPKEHWSFPDHIDQDRAAKVREEMGRKKIIYGDSISYRHMCRFESGFFFQHELLKNYEYYWRVEPSIELFCDIDYDPFKFMADNKKKYSFVLSLYEYEETIPTLWQSTRKFMEAHPEHLVAGNSLEFLSDDNGLTYNKCHFVSRPCCLMCLCILIMVNSGLISKLVISTGYEGRLTRTTSTPWIKTADSSTSVGVMLQYILLRLLCS